MLRSSVLAWACLALSAVSAHAQQVQLFDRDSHFVQIDRHASVPERVRAACPSAHATDYGALIKEQDAFVDSVRKPNASATAWLGLACSRALLFAMGAPSREGPMMRLGTPWISAAIDEVVEALTREPANPHAAQLLAAIAFEVVPARMPAGEEREGDRWTLTHHLEVTPPIVPRLANLLYRAVKLGVADSGVLRACTSLMFDAGDIATAHECSGRALALGSDSTWHLLRLTWLAVLRRDTTSAKQFFTAALRSAHAPSARAELGWHLESPCLPHNACSPTGLLAFHLPNADKGQWLVTPDSLVEQWFAAQLVEAARGDTTRFWRGEQGPWTQVRSAIRGGANWSALVRHLVAHFADVSYAGATFRACEVVNVTNPPCWTTLIPYGRAPLELVAQVDHLWDPATGSPIDLLPYTIVGTDLAAHDSAGRRTALVNLELRRWGGAGASDTTIRESLALPPHTPKHPAFTGYIVVPTLSGLDSWSLMASQVELRQGGVFQDGKAPLDSGPLVVSDLVLGMASQGLVWETGGRQVVLAPQDMVARNEPVRLYYQVKSDIDRVSVRTTLRLFPEGADRATTKPAMQIAFETPIRRGLNEIERELSVTQLASGRYWFDIEVVDTGADVTSRRSVVMYLM